MAVPDADFMSQTHQPLGDRLPHLSDTRDANFHALNSHLLIYIGPRA
jgi:hypothetical protein